MVEGQRILASAVIIPELEDNSHSPLSSTKRRTSSVSLGQSKRPRLSPPRDESTTSPPASAGARGARAGRVDNVVDERKRGRRLFGALLGTLSQNPTSTAQKRRIDIEKKQQEKLKLQAEEHDENKKRKQEALAEVRRAEQSEYRKQSMLMQHSNMLAAANFLQTKAEPKIYYKPWELLAEEKSRIKAQLVEAQTMIDQELAKQQGQDTKHAEEATDDHRDSTEPKTEPEDIKMETVGEAADEPESFDPSAEPPTNTQPNLNTIKVEDQTEATPIKEPVDDGGDDVVEGEEDNVIY